MKSVKITIVKQIPTALDSEPQYKVTRICRAISTRVAIPGRDRIMVGDFLSGKEADQLCERRNYEITIQ